MGKKPKFMAGLQVQAKQAHSAQCRILWEKAPGSLRGSEIWLLELKGTHFSLAGAVEVCLPEALKRNQDGSLSPGITVLLLLLVLQRDQIIKDY